MAAPDHRNITLRIDSSLFEAVQNLAAERQESVSRLITEMLHELVRETKEYAKAKESALKLLEAGFDLGTNGEANWKRSELHER